MTELVREERYIFSVGTEEHVLDVQELVWGAAEWPEKFRVALPGSCTREGEEFYGTTAREAAERAIEHLTAPVCAAKPLVCHYNLH